MFVSASGVHEKLGMTCAHNYEVVTKKAALESSLQKILVADRDVYKRQRLGEALEGVVEDCVNKVGVDLNTASASLLEYVSGINKTLAKNIVAYREENGAFKSLSLIHISESITSKYLPGSNDRVVPFNIRGE